MKSGSRETGGGRQNSEHHQISDDFPVVILFPLVSPSLDAKTAQNPQVLIMNGQNELEEEVQVQFFLA